MEVLSCGVFPQTFSEAPCWKTKDQIQKRWRGGSYGISPRQVQWSLDVALASKKVWFFTHHTLNGKVCDNDIAINQSKIK